MATILIALGANLGDRGETLSQAIDELAADADLTLISRSQLLVTKPVGGPKGQPDFLNAAAKFETRLSPQEVHQKLIHVEQRHGRERHERWGARKIDLDLLLYDSQSSETPQLTIPHPRMSFRRFVMQPAAEVASEMIHPELGVTIGELWHLLSTTPPVVEIAALPGPQVARLCQSVQESLGQQTISYANDSFLRSPEIATLLQSLPQTIAEHQDQRSLPPGCRARILPWWSGLPSVLAAAEASPLAEVDPPRLVVYWNRPDDTYGDTERTWWSAQEKTALQFRLAKAVQLNVHSPRLWLEGNDLESAATEVIAAIEAMSD